MLRRPRPVQAGPMHLNRLISIPLSLAMTAATVGVCLPASAGGIYTNCTALHTRWPHGVGRTHAHDHTSGTPVTTFKHSTRLYNRAMNHNSRLDADKDGIACEAA